jgi:hypothetical protein
MPKIDFAKQGAPSATTVPNGEATDPSTTAVATRPSNPVPTPYSDENIGLHDIILPRLNLVQKVGELSNVFDHGSLLLNGEQVLFTCPKDPKAAVTPLNILVLGFQPSKYVEKVEGGGRGGSYNTPAEVVEAGGTIDYNESKATGKPLYQESKTALVLIEKPEGVDDANFPHEFEGKKYCTALWTMKGTAYTHGAKVLLTARKIGKLRGPAGYRTAFYTLASKLTSFNNQWYYIPVLKPSVDTTEAFRNWVKDEVVGF